MLLGNGMVFVLIIAGIRASANDDTKQLKLVHVVSNFFLNKFLLMIFKFNYFSLH